MGLGRRCLYRKKVDGGISPDQIGNVEVWLDASDDIYLDFNSGNYIDEWYDRSGNNRHATILDLGANRFELLTSGRRRLRKNQTVMQTTSFTVGAFPISFFMVCNNLNATTSGSPLSYCNPSVLNQYLAFRYHTAPGIFYSQRNGGSEFVVTTPQINPGDVYHILEGVSVQNDLYRIASNGGSYSDGTTSQTYNTNMNRLLIGKLRSAGNNVGAAITQEYSEIVMFSKVLSSDERLGLMLYFANKWEITI